MPSPQLQPARPVASRGFPPGRSPGLFLVLVIILTIPFWVIGGFTDFELMPGLPVSALATFCPGLAALILARREGGPEGSRLLLRRAFNPRLIRPKLWYVPILLLMPFVMSLSFGIQRLSGAPVPLPQISIPAALSLAVLFLIAALGEEIGWSGYATDPLQDRWGTLWAAIGLGVFWALYHYIGLAQAARSIEWIAWWSLGTVAARILIVWLYSRAGKSVLAAALFHMTINLTWQLYPVQGSYYDPRIVGVLTALAAIVVIAVWRPARAAGARDGQA